MNFAFFSDLDDTLLDHQTYDFEAARPGIELLKRNDIPLVLMTSKTEEETLEFVERLGIEEAFSIENGGAAFIPRRYLSETEEKSLAKSESYMRIALGMRFAEIRAFFEDFQERQGAPFCSLTDLSPEEVFQLTGLPGDQAAKALARAYDLPFTAGSDAEEDLRRLAEEASPRGLTVVKGGRFYHLKGTADKGTSYDVLRPYYVRAFGPLRTVGLGDSENDGPFLAKVDFPVIIRRPDGGWNPRLAAALPSAIRTEGVGPAGWAEAVATVIRDRR